MKMMARQQRQVTTTKKRKEQRRKETKKRQEKRQQEREEEDKVQFSMEFGMMKRKYPKTRFKQIIFKNVNSDLRAKFHGKCAGNRLTVIGKLRYLMEGCVEGKFARLDDTQEERLSEIFGSKSEVTPAVVYNNIPKKLHQDFKRWCLLRRCTIQGRLRQLMIAYLEGAID